MLAATLWAHLQLSHRGGVSCGGSSSPGTLAPAQLLGPGSAASNAVLCLPQVPALLRGSGRAPCAGTHVPPADRERGFGAFMCTAPMRNRRGPCTCRRDARARGASRAQGPRAPEPAQALGGQNAGRPRC